MWRPSIHDEDAMPDSQRLDQWFETFPVLKSVSGAHLQLLRGIAQFPTLDAGFVAYRQDAECPNYLMCIEGLTRVFKMSDTGKEILLYRVRDGGTCILTTQCLLTGGNFPAESIAEKRTQLAAIPAGAFRQLMQESAAFRQVVLDDYTSLLGQMIGMVDELAFTSFEQRLARRILLDADAEGIVAKTHQQLASDTGSARESVTRALGEWERRSWIELERGKIAIRDRAALATLTA
jgi:CRP/FNR family transcriptional regulator